jgi:hypothetical protein
VRQRIGAFYRPGTGEEAMERFVGAAFVLFFGVGLSIYAFRAFESGEVRAGPNFLRGVFTPTRDDSPGAFYAFVLLYLCGGIALTAWGLLMAFGMAAPIALS